MTQFLYIIALLLGTAAVGWVSSVMADTNCLALIVSLVIGGVYSIGVVELFQYRQATATLLRCLSSLPEKVTDLAAWLDPLDASLRSSVRLRIEGNRSGLPGPILTPYLIGLLVMLGLLGTFVGMVATLKGAVGALEGATEIQAIREGLAAPIRGLGLAFGTSVAGVATSAMLGLMSTLSRRDRIIAARRLDSAAGIFQDFSPAHQQRETFRAIQLQTRSLPEVVEKMAAVTDKLDHLGDRLTVNQERFHETVKAMYAELAASVAKSHQENLSESLRLASERIQPILQEAMAHLSAETRQVHGLLTRSASETLREVSGTFSEMSQKTVQELSGRAQAMTGRMHQEMTGLLTSFEDLIQTRMKTETAWLEQHGGRMDALTAALKAELFALREAEDQRGQAAVSRLATLEDALASHLARIAKEIESPMNRLIQTAGQVPLAASEVIGQLREEAARSLERDNRFLEEHRSILAQIDSLSRTLAATSIRQQDAIEQLVESSGCMLETVAGRVTEQVGAEASNLSRVAESFAVSAVEMASLGDAFTAAVRVFAAANDGLMENLTRIEASLDKTALRSDEQLGYYVAQAREIVDYCVLSQKEIVDALQQLRPPNAVNPESNEWKN